MNSSNWERKIRAVSALIVAIVMVTVGLAVLGGSASAQAEDAKFTGTVTLGGLPAEDTLVMYSMGDFPMGNSTLTAVDGSYEIWVEGGDTYSLLFANGEAMFDMNAMVEQYIDSGETVVVDTDLTPAAERTVTLKGYVLNASNLSQPVTDCHVLGMEFNFLFGGDMPEYINWTVPNPVTGYYEVMLLEGAIAAAVFDADGYLPAMAGVEDGPQMILASGEIGWLNVSMIPVSSANVTVTGTVTDVSNGLPIAGVTVEAQMEGLPFSESDITNATGGYMLMMLEGQGNMMVSAPGYADVYNWDIDFSGNMTIDYQLYPNDAKIHGWITDEVTLAPIENASVRAQSWLGGGMDMSNETLTDASGYYELEVPGDRNWDINAEADGYGDNWSWEFVTSMTDISVNLTLMPENSMFKGYITDLDSSLPISGVYVILQNAWIEDEKTTITNSSGYYEIACIAGNYTFMFIGPPTGYMIELQIPFSGNYGISSGETIWVNYSLKHVSTEIHGNITDDMTAAPLSGVQVIIQHFIPNSTFVRAIIGMSNSTGIYSLNVVPDNNTVIQADLEGYEPYWSMTMVPDVSMFDWSFTMIPISPPIIEYYATPDENISMRNPADLGAIVTDSALNEFSMMVCDILSMDSDVALLQRLDSYWFYPGNPMASNILGSEIAGGVWDIGMTWDTNSSSVFAISFADDIDRIVTDNYWFDGSNYRVWGYYYNDTYGEGNGDAVFDDMTGKLIGIELGSGPDLDAAQDPTGEFWVDLWNGIYEYDLITQEAEEIWDPVESAHLSTAEMTIENIPGPTFTFMTGEWAVLYYASDTYAVSYNMTVIQVDNTPPNADAGAGQTAATNETITLDGSASNDNNGIVNYTWELDLGATTEVLYGVMIEYAFDALGNYTVMLTVSDGANLEDIDTTYVLVVPDSEDPIADAGIDQEVDEDTVVTFDGTGSSDNVGIVNYTWTFDDGGVQTLYGIAPEYNFTNPGVYEVMLNVTDDAGNWDTDNVTITVSDVTDPIADAGADQETDENTEVTFDGTGSSDNVGIVNYTWTFNDDGAQTLYGEEPVYTFSEPGTYTITLNVSDDAGNWDTDTMTVTVNESEPLDDEPPIADAGENIEAEAGSTVTFDGSGSTDNIGIVNYTWVLTIDDETLYRYGVSPTYTFDIAGTYDVQLIVRDAVGLTDIDTVVVEITEPSESTFIEDNWMILLIIVVIVVAALVAAMAMRGRKGGKTPTPMEDKMEEELPPPPED